MHTRPPRTLVILPTYNERFTLETVVRDVRRLLPQLDILIIDDNSPDGTGAIANTLAAADSQITVRHRTGKNGLGTAYTFGFTYAMSHQYEYIVEMDSDGSHLAAELPALLSAARAGAGLVIGSRWIPGGSVINWPWYRRWVSRTGTRVSRFLLRSQLRDLTSGFRVISICWLNRVNFTEIASHGYGFQVELAATLERLGCPVAEVPITFVERIEGTSKMSFGIVLEALWRVMQQGWRLRFNRRAASQPPEKGSQYP